MYKIVVGKKYLNDPWSKEPSSTCYTHSSLLLLILSLSGHFQNEFPTQRSPTSISQTALFFSLSSFLFLSAFVRFFFYLFKTFLFVFKCFFFSLKVRTGKGEKDPAHPNLSGPNWVRGEWEIKFSVNSINFP